jgi:hypothetical protein
MRAVWAFLARTIRATRLVARDNRIPKPFRWLAALGLLPIPGPFDEALLLLVAVPLFLFYREPMRDAWRRALPVSEPSSRSKNSFRSSPPP